VREKLPEEASLERARELLARIPLVDSHNDLPYVIRKDRSARGDVATYGLDQRLNHGDTDIPRLRDGMVAGQFWAAFCPTDQADPTRFTLELIQQIRDYANVHPDVFLLALRASDVARARREGKIASFIAIESGIGIGDRLEMLDVFHALGARYMTLCHNETLDWVDSATDAPRHGGLTEFGREVVRRMNRVGLLVDLSHTTSRVMHQALDISEAPVAITHSNAFALCDHPRNTPDDVLARLKANGGIVMATFVPTFINQALRDWVKPLQAHGKAPLDADWGKLTAARAARAGPPPRATLAEVCDHVEHLARVAGVDHVGIGSDFYGGPTPDGLEDSSCFPNLIAALMERGWDNRALAKLAGGNFLRVLRKVERVARHQRGQPRSRS
jgi:membrane dipeptidase